MKNDFLTVLFTEEYRTTHGRPDRCNKDCGENRSHSLRHQQYRGDVMFGRGKIIVGGVLDTLQIPDAAMIHEVEHFQKRKT